ncbi:hypothetical protein EXU85_18285 [Spirosoma sp. KCTC 42546]|uniref:hypothetical protein n=1 Tax=Spirosoma sp. KCTC 42546 TaxID=2520506 RepID=UPI00115A1767|nr:hypothetical protein [Spirosoma sp. KCTC 42546]QDK80447.1 hypothetical protein EXU85_18285 [Spirosoma sp. KCTC 42546]
MKTSYILLAIVAVMALTGMVATDVLLKQQYDKIDWTNPYQEFEHRALPTAKHIRIEAAPVAEIIVEPSTDTTQVSLLPSMANSYRARLHNDTLFISFLMNYDGNVRNPHNDIGSELPPGMVLRLPDLQSLYITNGRLTVRKFKSEKLAISIQNSRLRTNKLDVLNLFDLTVRNNSFAELGPDHYQSLHTIAHDSSGVQLNNTQINAFNKELSPQAEIYLRGQAMKWLK